MHWRKENLNVKCAMTRSCKRPALAAMMQADATCFYQSSRLMPCIYLPASEDGDSPYFFNARIDGMVPVPAEKL